jgi:serine/threonine protein kinase
MTVNCLAALPPNDPFAGRAKYKKLGILGGSEVAAVYAVRRADDPIDDDTSHTGRGLSSFTSFTNRSKVTTDQEFMMKTFQGTTPEAEDKIRKEIRALKLLNHRNVVKIYDSFQEHGQIYIVTDLYVGGNLASRLPYTEQEAARIVMQLLSGVKYLHDQDIVHTALSMETVLFNSGSDDAEIKIVNLGISRKFLNQEMFTPEAEDQGLYSASPESFRGVHTKKGDMWSIGVIAYYLVSGSKPFWGKRWLEKLQNAEVWFEADVWNTVSKEATNFIAALLNLDITQRPDASKAMSYRWIAWNSLPTMVRSRSEDETRSEPCLRCEEFNRVAMNVGSCYVKEI